MKYNLSTFPEFDARKASIWQYLADTISWQSQFEAELRQIQGTWKFMFGSSRAMIPIEELLGEVDP